jgi:integrase
MSEERFQLGEFWLSQRSNSPVWCITWFEPKKRQTRRHSTGHVDFEQAKVTLAAHFVAHATLTQEKPEDVPISMALDQYYEHHAKHTKSGEGSAKPAIAKWKAFWSGSMLADMTIERQKEFKAWLEAYTFTRGKDATPRYLSGGTIARQWNVGPTAFEWMLANHKIKYYPAVPYLSDNARRERVLSLEEMAALFNAADSEHMWRWLILAVSTAARPNAPCAITPGMVNLPGNFVTLLPPGMQQNPKKRRPTLPLCATLRGWLEAWLQPEAMRYESSRRTIECMPTLITWRGKPIDNIKEGFVRLKDAAGLTDPLIIPYTVRHTMITWIMKQRVPEWDREVWFGHKEPGNATTAGYIHLDPDYLRPAAQATDAYFDALAPYVKMPLRVSCVSAYSQVVGAESVKPLDLLDSGGARYRDRTCDPHHVKEGGHQ